MHSSLSSPHQDFILWAKQQGVKVTDVLPAQIPTKGMGIVAQRRIEAGEELVNVPVSALFSVRFIPRDFRDMHKGVTVHGLLASFLAFNGPELDRFQPWFQTWPSRRDLEVSMPLYWLLGFGRMKSTNNLGASSPNMTHNFSPEVEGQRCSPSTAGHTRNSPRQFNNGLLEEQIMRLHKDWDIVSKIFPDEKLEAYTYSWLLVNTRSFYYELSGAKGLKFRKDHMVLCPFIDYFNHNDNGCHIAFDDKGYRVISDRIYETGEEIFVSYGSHSNDYLLVEYGFILEKNKWDSLPIDHLLTPQYSNQTQQQLQTAGYLGNYTLNRDGICHRTQVAVRATTMAPDRWHHFINGTYDDDPDPADERTTDRFIVRQIMDPYYAQAGTAIQNLADAAATECGVEPVQRAVLIRRWTQIREMIVEALRANVNACTGIAWVSWSEFVD